MDRSKTLRARLVLLACAASLAPHALADWPAFVGDGDRTPPRRGQALVDHLDKARIQWELERFTTVGKGLYPGTLEATNAMGVEPFYGGANSPIAADGRVFLSYYKPDGKAPAEPEGWRTVDDPQRYLPDWFFSVTADDITIAVDAGTGELLWERIEEGKGFHRLGHKRGHWSVSPAYADGRVFSLGGAGRLYAYDARSGDKLWETLAVPAMEEERQESIEARRLVWHAGYHRSLHVAAGNVILPAHGLRAFEAESGEPRWTLDDLLATHATPVTWEHGGKDFLLVHDGTGEVRLVDAARGEVIWTATGFGEQIGTLNLTGDVVILNAQSEAPGVSDKRNGLFGAFRVSMEGLKHLWTLPDAPEYRHSWTLDRGAERRSAIQDGYVYFTVGTRDLDRLVVVELGSGRVVSEQPVDATGPYPMEDRLLLYDDRAHTDPVRVLWYSLEDPARPKPLHSVTQFPPRMTTSYETPIQYPYVDGRLYLRTLGGLAAYDLRALPLGATKRQEITFPEIAMQPAWTRGVALEATATSGLPVKYVVEDGPARIVGGALKLTGEPGIVTVVATQPGNATWIRADPVRQHVGVGDVAPPVPADVHAAPYSPTRIEVTWQAAASNATGYIVESRRPGERWRVTDRVGRSRRRYVHTRLAPHVPYEHRVRSVNEVTRSRPSAVASAATYSHSPGIWLEAEATEVGDAWKIVRGEEHSAGAYLEARRDDRLTGMRTDAPPEDVLRYEVYLPVPGQYRLAGHTRFGGGGANSFFARIDDRPWRVWPVRPGGGWSLHRYGTVMFDDVPAGPHTLEISVRESGTGLDKIYLHPPRDGMTEPEGFGVEASNLAPPVELEAPQGVELQDARGSRAGLRWRGVDKARGYIIERRLEGRWRPIDYVAAPATGWRPPAGASGESAGPWRVRAWREVAVSGPSDAVGAGPAP